ncbi:hypothetical protein [Pseudomonas sp.]|uniref:DUF4376 domain-containing protein n=1 Tax=Pseudomonas sp. TaxID=306 RepID=UPI00289A7E8B|nr:hypothetical protein [Pseudomonas sp.]
MRYAYFDPNNRAVLGWFDTEAFEVNLPPAEFLIELTSKQWDTYSSSSCWVDYSGRLVTSAPELVIPLEQAVAAKLAELETACAAQIAAGFSSDALGETYTYPAKPTDQSNLQASVLASILPGVDASWTTPFWCADVQGKWAYQAHTAAQIQQVGVDGKNAINAAIAQKIVLEQQVEAAKTAAEVAAIIWPQDEVAA